MNTFEKLARLMSENAPRDVRDQVCAALRELDASMELVLDFVYDHAQTQQEQDARSSVLLALRSIDDAMRGS